MVGFILLATASETQLMGVTNVLNAQTTVSATPVKL
jgi:hypothetical protein